MVKTFRRVFVLKIVRGAQFFFKIRFLWCYEKAREVSMVWSTLRKEKILRNPQHPKENTRSALSSDVNTSTPAGKLVHIWPDRRSQP